MIFIAIKTNAFNDLKNFEDALLQLGFNIVNNQADCDSYEINFVKKNHEISITASGTKEVILKTPFHIRELKNAVQQICDNYEITFEVFSYRPSSGTIIYKNKRKPLSEIQSKILSHLIFYKKGIDKALLYKALWPKDINISENKLDTHLTNLKTNIHDLSGYMLSINTSKKIVKLKFS